MALAFIIGRIDEQAYRSGEPLDGDERFLLGNLPTTTDMQPSSVSEFGANLAPRDLAFEKLVRLAKAVHHYDLKSGTQPASDWNFATAVSKLNRHPISWLLEWAGIKQQRPWWDRWLLVAFGLVLVICCVGSLLFVDGDRFSGSTAWTLVGIGYVLLLVVIHFGLRRLEAWQLKRTIEASRRVDRELTSR